MALNLEKVTIWIAQGEVDGREHHIVFDSEPDLNQILDMCQDMDSMVEVYVVDCLTTMHEFLGSWDTRE